MDKAVSEDLHALATPEKLEHIRRNWRVKRVGWVVLAILVLAGAAGLFGDGPLSSTIRSANGLTLEFDRFVRRERPFTLKLHLVPQPGSSEARLTLSRRYFDDVRLSSVMPEPVAVLANSDWTTFVFAVDDASALAVNIHVEADRSGLAEGEIAAGNARLRFTQIIWP